MSKCYIRLSGDHFLVAFLGVAEVFDTGEHDNIACNVEQ